MSKSGFRLFPVGLLLAIAWGLVGCAAKDQVLQMKDHGRTIDLRTGSTLEIVLPGNPTTGFLWEIAKVDARILALQGEIEFQPSSDQLGAGGDFVVQFEAKNPGSTELLLIYQRPFEVDRDPENLFEITVNVTG